jgi:hypothetical protein
VQAERIRQFPERCISSLKHREGTQAPSQSSSPNAHMRSECSFWEVEGGKHRDFLHRTLIYLAQSAAPPDCMTANQHQIENSRNEHFRGQDVIGTALRRSLGTIGRRVHLSCGSAVNSSPNLAYDKLQSSQSVSWW